MGHIQRLKAHLCDEKEFGRIYHDRYVSFEPPNSYPKGGYAVIDIGVGLDVFSKATTASIKVHACRRAAELQLEAAKTYKCDDIV